MNILAIETSCDETALCIMEAEKNEGEISFNLLSNILHSQIKEHEKYGGVFPSLAKREHARRIVPLLKEVVDNSKLSGKSNNIDVEKFRDKFNGLFSHEENLSDELLSFLKENNRPDIDLIAVTEGPGLEPALWVGINTAIALSIAWRIPVMPVNHLEGHIASVVFDPEENKTLPFPIFPSLALIISGGHTEMIKMNDWGSYKYIGGTLDDAVGEAFDKVARMIDIPYPGGPKIAQLAEEARETREKGERADFSFPRPMINSGDNNFSFSGLKTSAMYKIKEMEHPLSDKTKRMISRELEEAITETLLSKVSKVIENEDVSSLIISGGVSANQHIKNEFKKLSLKYNIPFHIPHIKITTDNAVMIALSSAIRSIYSKEKFSVGEKIEAKGNLEIV